MSERIELTLRNILFSAIPAFEVTAGRGQGKRGNDPEDPDAREAEISEAGRDGAFIFSDGSLLEGGNVGGGAMVIGKDVGEKEVECGIGDVATVWDGEVAGMAEGLSQVQEP